MSGRSILVTGTDTGVGKTFVLCQMIRDLRSAGLGVFAMKPMETGVADLHCAGLDCVGTDAYRLWTALDRAGAIH